MSFITSTLKRIITTVATIMPAAAATFAPSMPSYSIDSGLRYPQNQSFLGCPSGQVVVAIIPVNLKPNTTETDILICKDDNDIWSAIVIDYSAPTFSMVPTITSTTSVSVAISTSQNNDTATTDTSSQSSESAMSSSNTPISLSTPTTTNADLTATETFAGVPTTTTLSQASTDYSQRWSFSSGTVYPVTTTPASFVQSSLDTMITTSSSNESSSPVTSFASFTTSYLGFTVKHRNCTPSAK